MKKSLFVFIIGFVGFVSVWTCASVQAEVVNRVIATVDDEPITLHEIRSLAKSPTQQAMFLPPGGAATMADKDLLEVLIMNKLITKEVEAQGIKAKPEDIDSYIERIKNQSRIDDEQFKAALATQGMTMEAYRQQVANEIERALLVNREIGSHVNVTPEDVERYYKANSADYTQAEQVRVRHIFLPFSAGDPAELLAQMEDIRKRAVGGEDFGALADQNSKGPGVGQGGDLGYFKKGQMSEEIDEVAFSLKSGEISQPFRTNTGVHLIKVEEHTQPGQTTLDKASVEQIKSKLYNEALKKRYDRWFQEDLRFRHNIENFLAAAPTRSSRDLLKKPSAEPAGQTTAAQAPKEEPGFLDSLWPF